MRRFAPLLFLGALAAGLPACDQDSRMVTMRVDHFRVPCYAGQPGFCLRVTDPEPLTVDEIGGFEHTWGVVSEVVVLVTETPDGDTQYDLVEVLGEQPVEAGARFDLPLSPEFIESADPYGFELVSNKPVRCHTAEVCRQVTQAMFDGLEFTVELGYPESGATAFVAYDIALSAQN